MKPTVIYNVLVKGYSVGMTFNHAEALGWANATTGAKIVHVPYRMERPI
jgi:hypothetical protein